MSDMGAVRTTIKIENPLKRGELRELLDTLVDAGAAHSLGGLNLKIDPHSKKLLDAGPIVAAVA